MILAVRLFSYFDAVLQSVLSTFNFALALFLVVLPLGYVIAFTQFFSRNTMYCMPCRKTWIYRRI